VTVELYNGGIVMIGLFITQLDDDDRAFMLDLYKKYYNLARKTIYSITYNNENILNAGGRIFNSAKKRYQLSTLTSEDDIIDYMTIVGEKAAIRQSTIDKAYQ
jgi:hypothetical protein